MFYLWKSETNNNILIDRLKTKQAVLRSQNDGVVLPLLKATNTKLSSIFSDINGCHENHAARLEWYDTANIITHILHDDASLKMYKPSSMMYYSISISGEKNLNFVTVEFAVYYHIWKIVDNDQPKPEFKDIVTETIHYCYTFTAEQYKDILLLITIYNREVAEQLLEKSNNPDSDISSGKSAFEIWKELGNEGDESDFIASLKGEDGKSAYQLWLDNGNKGTVSDFLDSLKGTDGESVYELYVSSGGTLSEEEFQNSLVNPVQWGSFS